MAIVYIVYLDDSGTTGRKRSGSEPFQVVTAVIVKDEEFMHVEFQRDSVLEGLAEGGTVVPELHAVEILGRREKFTEMTQQEANWLLKSFLVVTHHGDVPIVYGAVDKTKLSEQPYGSARPLDMAFRLCAAGVEKWFVEEAPNEMGIFVVDDGQHTKDLRETYGLLRKGPIFEEGSGLAHMHDDVYFGSSVNSAGLQLADACASVILRHLKGNPDTEDIYEWIEGSIFYGKTEP